MLSARPPRRHRLSALLICRDEADRIEACLQSLAGWVDELIVLDSGSRDDTVAIARRYSTQVYETDWPGYGAQRQRALEKASGDYILSIDADERATPELRAEIDALLAQAQPACGSWQLRWEFWFLGARIRHGRFESPQTRLFRREGLRWPPLPVHEAPILPPGPTGLLQARLPHHSFRNLRHAYEKHSEYAWLIAQQKYAAGKRASLGMAMLRGGWELFVQLLLRGLWRDGAPGLQLALLLAHYAFLKYAYLASLSLESPPVSGT
ncbi:Glycosyltransferase involved in cell wall bisynthesis [Solimonas aquatica]|uniref:Glycosyltransferase involved in cell wall bisynthesis n=1 Tax=Solimonas aquatica TaxID=489703 RepID=A0A1H9CLU8_9GAMM|nr:glycosyltransferase family 2 protein [Solimonas aquatica]SEQ02139.1 Glycosyltransferase involved in cell wall bisynthesis [Solimonas aquatica]